MRILIVAYYFPPETYARMASLRPYSWAKYWQKAGHEITILTTPKNRSQTELDLQDRVKIEEVPLLPFKPRRESERTPSESPKRSKSSFLRGLLIKLQKKLGAGTLLYGSNIWIIGAIKRAIDLHGRQPFDIIVSTYGPPASHVVAGILKKRYNLFWVADYRDLWHDNTFTRAEFPFSLVENKLENYYVSDANLITTVSQPLAQQLKEKFNLQIHTIENGFDLDDIPIGRYPFAEDYKVRLVYTGSIYVGKRDPLSLFEAIAQLDRTKTNLEILFYTLEKEYIDKLTEKYKLQAIVKNLGFIDRIDCLKIQKSVDALIFLDWNDVNTEGILTGKIFEYMYSGRPILCIGADRETIASRLIEEAGIGVSLGNDTGKIADYLRNLLDGINPDYNPAPSVLGKYTREGLSQKMLLEIEKQRRSQGYE